MTKRLALALAVVCVTTACGSHDAPPTQTSAPGAIDRTVLPIPDPRFPHRVGFLNSLQSPAF